MRIAITTTHIAAHIAGTDQPSCNQSPYNLSLGYQHLRIQGTYRIGQLPVSKYNPRQRPSCYQELRNRPQHSQPVQHSTKGRASSVPLIQAAPKPGSSPAIYGDDVFQEWIESRTHRVTFWDGGDSKRDRPSENVHRLEDKHLQRKDEEKRRNGHGQHAHHGWIGDGPDD